MSTVPYRFRGSASTAVQLLLWLAGGVAFSTLVLVTGLESYALIAAFGVTLITWLCLRSPVLVVAGVLIVTCGWNAITAYAIQLPPHQLVFAASLGFIVAAGIQLASPHRRFAVRPWVSVIGLGLFAIGSLAGVWYTEATFGGALKGWTREFAPFLLFPGLGYLQISHEVRWRMVKVAVAIGVLVGGYAIFRYITGQTARELRIAATINDVGGGEVALFGSFSSRADLAGWCAAMAPVFVSMALVWKGRWRYISGVAAALALFALIPANTRSPIVGAIVALSAVVFLHIVARSAGAYRPLVVMAPVVLALVAVAAFAITISGGETSDRYRSLLHPTKDLQFDARQKRWAFVQDELRGHPFGYGLGTAGSAQLDQGRVWRPENAAIDNAYLTIAYQFGYALTALFTLLMALLVFDLARSGVAGTDRQITGITIGAAGALIAFLVDMSTSGEFERLGTPMVQFVVAIAIGFVVTGPKGVRD